MVRTKIDIVKELTDTTVRDMYNNPDIPLLSLERNSMEDDIKIAKIYGFTDVELHDMDEGMVIYSGIKDGELNYIILVC